MTIAVEVTMYTGNLSAGFMGIRIAPNFEAIHSIDVETVESGAANKQTGLPTD